MKPAAFEYACPTSIDEAVALLASRDDAKAIAGGQSLMPLMAFRLATPSLLVDLRKLPNLDRIVLDTDFIRLGARVRWCDILQSTELARAHPLLVAAIGHVAHYQIRNRGTVGGSVAHADGAAEMPGLVATVDAQITVVGVAGTRVIPASQMFVGPLQTVLAADEIITEIALPAWKPGRRWGFEEFSRRRGDFALAGVALYYDEDAQGLACNAHLGVIGTAGVPGRVAQAEGVLNGKRVDEALIIAVARAAAAAVDLIDDLHASAAYRRALVETLVERALRAATLS